MYQKNDTWRHMYQNNLIHTKTCIRIHDFCHVSVYKSVYRFFDTYWTMYQNNIIKFDTNCNMYHFFDTPVSMYQKMYVYHFYWYKFFIFFIHPQYVSNIWYICWYTFWYFDTPRFGDPLPSIRHIEAKQMAIFLPRLSTRFVFFQKHGCNPQLWYPKYVKKKKLW